MQADQDRKHRNQRNFHNLGKKEEESPPLTPQPSQRRMLRAPRLLTPSPTEPSEEDEQSSGEDGEMLATLPEIHW